VIDVVTEYKTDLGLDPRLKDTMQVDFLSEWNVHVVEQHAVIRAINAELGLDGLGGQPDLAADQAPPGTQAVLGVGFLNRIGHRNIVSRQEIANRLTRRVRLMGSPELLGCFDDRRHL
jgi:hypothetical protein